jgi:hypothetical protein
MLGMGKSGFLFAARQRSANRGACLAGPFAADCKRQAGAGAEWSKKLMKRELTARIILSDVEEENVGHRVGGAVLAVVVVVVAEDKIVDEAFPQSSEKTAQTLEKVAREKRAQVTAPAPRSHLDALTLPRIKNMKNTKDVNHLLQNSTGMLVRAY